MEIPSVRMYTESIVINSRFIQIAKLSYMWLTHHRDDKTYAVCSVFAVSQCKFKNNKFVKSLTVWKMVWKTKCTINMSFKILANVQNYLSIDRSVSMCGIIYAHISSERECKWNIPNCLKKHFQPHWQQWNCAIFVRHLIICFPGCLDMCECCHKCTQLNINVPLTITDMPNN